MTAKKRKIVDIVVNSVVSVIIVLVILLTVNILVTGNKGYTPLFGNTYVVVRSDSMKGEGKDNFEKGDMLKVKLLSKEQKKTLQEGEVITFYQEIQGKIQLNSHRIVAIGEDENGEVIFRTKGDNNTSEDSGWRKLDGVIGKVTGKAGGIGKFVLWLNSTSGFFVCVFTPSLIVVAYCVYNLVRVILERNRELTEDKKAELKKELMAQLVAEGKLSEDVLKEESATDSPDTPAQEQAESAQAGAPDGDK